MKKSLEQRIAEVIREEIDLSPYNLDWPRLFDLEAAFLRNFLPEGSIGRIEHFGSTAVPGLVAKPIVDLLVEVRSLTEAQELIAPALESQGYDYFWRTDVSPPYAWFIKRNLEGKRTHHLHLVEANSILWERLLFRDYLRENPDIACRYASLKCLLAEQYPADRIAYTQGKTEFVVNITKQAKSFLL